jgi:A/G-specific adenine glycosylase
MQLSSSLLEWFDKNKRELPFRKNRNPYSIWISEVMLQQTKVETVIPYYMSWIKKFPNIEAVAEASEESILKSWEGLGYYSRCKNFHKAAKIIVNDYGSVIPKDWQNFRSLPGVGDYTAGAVLSIAFNKNHLAIDGNVKRVTARITARKKLSKYNLNYIKSFLQKNMDEKRVGDFNEAVMELGACICLPRSPKCRQCPVNSFCIGYKNGHPDDYPQKLLKKEIPVLTFVGGIIRFENKILIQKRDSQMLNGLWEIPMKKINLENNFVRHFKEYIYNKYGYNISFKKVISEIEHVYSHFKMKLIVMDFLMADEANVPEKSFSWISKSDIDEYAFHKANHKVFKLFKYSNWDV